MGKFRQLWQLSALDTIMVGYYSLMFLFASTLPWSKYYRLDLVSIYQYIKTYHKSYKKNDLLFIIIIIYCYYYLLLLLL